MLSVFAAWSDSTSTVSRSIQLLFCFDGFYPFDNEQTELVATEFCVLSLSPIHRYKTENMLMYMLLQEKLKASQQVKFFRYVVDNELREELHLHGIVGYSSVRIFGISMDLKGREKFLRQTTCGSYFRCAV